MNIKHAALYCHPQDQLDEPLIESIMAIKMANIKLKQERSNEVTWYCISHTTHYLQE